MVVDGEGRTCHCSSVVLKITSQNRRQPFRSILCRPRPDPHRSRDPSATSGRKGGGGLPWRLQPSPGASLSRAMSRKPTARPASASPLEESLPSDPFPSPIVVEPALPRLPAGVTATQPSAALIKAGEKIVVWAGDGRAEVRTGYALVRLAAGDSYEVLVNRVADGAQYLEIHMPTGGRELVRGPTNRCARGAAAPAGLAKGTLEWCRDIIRTPALPPQPIIHSISLAADPQRIALPSLHPVLSSGLHLLSPAHHDHHPNPHPQVGAPQRHGPLHRRSSLCKARLHAVNLGGASSADSHQLARSHQPATAGRSRLRSRDGRGGPPHGCLQSIAFSILLSFLHCKVLCSLASLSRSCSVALTSSLAGAALLLLLFHR
jgi:hypothetical protein